MQDVLSANASIGRAHYITKLGLGDHTMTVDEPVSYGGEGAGPSPSHFMAAALAACTVITLRMYADRKGWPLERIDAHAEMLREDATHTRFKLHLTLEGDLTDEQRARALQIANACPVHKVLAGDIVVEDVVMAG